MQTINKFKPANVYESSCVWKTVEIVERNGQMITFKVVNLKTNASYKERARAVFKADENGAFEEFLTIEGLRVRSSWRLLTLDEAA